MRDARTGDPVDQQAQEPLTPRKRGLFRRGEDGLTTLEWLLIVAAVAGLAALAVVLVTNVVDNTAEQIGGSSARKTAAQIAALSVTQKAHDDPPAIAAANFVVADDTAAWTAKLGEYQSACTRLNITYGDVDGLSATWTTVGVPAAGTSAAALTAWRAGLDKATNAPTEGCNIP